MITSLKIYRKFEYADKNTNIQILFDGGIEEKYVISSCVFRTNQIYDDRQPFWQSDSIKDKYRYSDTGNYGDDEEHFIMLEFWCSEEKALDWIIKFCELLERQPD